MGSGDAGGDGDGGGGEGDGGAGDGEATGAAGEGEAVVGAGDGVPGGGGDAASAQPFIPTKSDSHAASTSCSWALPKPTA